MKKILLTVALSLVISTQAMAKDCVGGTTFEAQNNALETVEYCVSDSTLNWFAANAWCHSQGREMVTLEFACDQPNPSYNCPKLSGKGPGKWGWLKNSYDEDRSYGVYTHSGSVSYTTRLHSDGHSYAFCY